MLDCGGRRWRRRSTGGAEDDGERGPATGRGVFRTVVFPITFLRIVSRVDQDEACVAGIEVPVRNTLHEAGDVERDLRAGGAGRRAGAGMFGDITARGGPVGRPLPKAPGRFGFLEGLGNPEEVKRPRLPRASKAGLDRQRQRRRHDIRAFWDEILGVELEERPPLPFRVVAPPRDQGPTVEVGVGIRAAADRRVRDLGARLVQNDRGLCSGGFTQHPRAAQDYRERANQTSSRRLKHGASRGRVHTPLPLAR